MNESNGSGALVRQDQFGGQSIATVQETATAAVAAQAKAAVEARWIVAMRQPRDMDQVRSDLLRECKRPSFAAVARYNKPIGRDGIQGLSIRFVEQALQAMGNVDSEAITIYDDREKRIIEVRVTDFQRNVCHRKQITLSKTVERNRLRDGQTPIARRTGSNGQTVYIVEATDDELLNKEAALVSKALRTCGLRLIPGWLQDEAEELIKRTALDEAARDPDAERRAIADAFADLGVQPSDLSEYLGADLGKVAPAQLVQLRQVYATIRAGEATWQDMLEHAGKGREAKPAAAPAAPPVGRGTQAVKDMINRNSSATGNGPSAPPVQAAPQQAAAAAPAPATPAPAAKEPEPQKAAPAPAQKADEPSDPKWPSRSKAARAEREAELRSAGVPVTDPKAAQQYIAHGDPRNKAKALAPREAAPPAPAVAQTESGDLFDQATGEVLEPDGFDDDDEPDWMKAPPPDDFR